MFRLKELMKLRKKISTTVQILSHIKEKLSFVQQQRAEAEAILEEKEKEVKQVKQNESTLFFRFLTKFFIETR